jgi:hypothetical protein
VVTLKRHYVNKNDMISFIFGFQLSNLNFIISVMKHFNPATVGAVLSPLRQGAVMCNNAT